MSNEEICYLYRHAKDPAQQISILSDLTLKKKAEIIEILKKAGLTVVTQKKRYHSWSDEEDKQFLELREKGLSYKEIGRIMLRTEKALETRFSKLHKKEKKG